jgi:hypothetical protein
VTFQFLRRFGDCHRQLRGILAGETEGLRLLERGQRQSSRIRRAADVLISSSAFLYAAKVSSPSETSSGKFRAERSSRTPLVRSGGCAVFSKVNAVAIACASALSMRPTSLDQATCVTSWPANASRVGAGEGFGWPYAMVKSRTTPAITPRADFIQPPPRAPNLKGGTGAFCRGYSLLAADAAANPGVRQRTGSILTWRRRPPNL